MVPVAKALRLPLALKLGAVRRHGSKRREQKPQLAQGLRLLRRFVELLRVAPPPTTTKFSKQ